MISTETLHVAYQTIANQQLAVSAPNLVEAARQLSTALSEIGAEIQYRQTMNAKLVEALDDRVEEIDLPSTASPRKPASTTVRDMKRKPQDSISVFQELPE